MSKKECIYEIDPKDVIRIMTESRAFFWLMIKYRLNPERFKNIPYEELFDFETIMKVFLDLDWLLTQFGVVIDANI